tara:strand:+ start:8779 stop:9084 length:306 start_codon:yes stop_codon:yes gene_type:complete
MRRIIVNKKASERETSRATRTRARGGLSKYAKKEAKIGLVGMFDFEFSLVQVSKRSIKASNKVVQEKTIHVDSYDDAIFYAHVHTPMGHQGLIDGISVVIK